MKCKMKKSFLLILTPLIFILSACGGGMDILFEEANGEVSIIPDSAEDVVEAPLFNYPSGNYSADMQIEITSLTTGAEIFYSIDDKIPDENARKYASKVNITGNKIKVKIRAKAYLDGVYSDESVALYSIDYGQVSTPQFTVAGKANPYQNGGTFEHDINIALTCSTDGAVIYYTTDGKTPTAGSIKYNKPLPLNGLTGCMTISVIAIKGGMDDSTIETATFTVDYATTEPPYFDLPPGNYSQTQEVHLLCETIGARIMYTTDGTDPRSSKTAINGTLVLVNRSMTIRAYAMKAGMWSSAVSEAKYTITSN